MLVTVPLLALAVVAAARPGPARLSEREPAAAAHDRGKPRDVGFQFQNDGRCIHPNWTLVASEPIVAEGCKGSKFPGWNLDGASIGAAHHLKVANTNLCLSAGTNHTEWMNGYRLSLQECVYETNTETWKNTQVWRKDVINGLGAYRLMDQEWLSPYDHFPSEYCMDVEEGWNPDWDNSWELQLWKCGGIPNQNQKFIDNWKARPNA